MLQTPFLLFFFSVTAIVLGPVVTHSKRDENAKKIKGRALHAQREAKLLSLLDPEFKDDDIDSPGPREGAGDSASTTQAPAASASPGVSGATSKSTTDQKGVIGNLIDSIKHTLHIGRRSNMPITNTDINDDDDNFDDIDDDSDEAVELERRDIFRRAHRRKRWDYDTEYDWENDGEEYSVPVSFAKVLHVPLGVFP